MSSRFGKVRNQMTRASGSLWMRAFSSSVRCPLRSHKPHIVRQLSCYNEMHLLMKKWLPSELFAERNEFLNEVVAGRLIRPADIAIGPKFMKSLIGTKTLRQGICLVAVNLMNGRNVSHLLTPENVLFSEEEDILLRETHLPGEEELEGPEYNHLAFEAWHDLYFGKSGVSGLLGKSAGRTLVDQDLSLDLIDLRGNLANAALVDKRLITNHQAQMYPEEINQLILLVNQFTRNEAASTPHSDIRRICAGNIFTALGELVPNGLYGIHPMFDYWLRHGKDLGNLISAMDGGAVARTQARPQTYYLYGMILVAVMRTSIMHPFGPWRARSKVERSHSKEHLESIVPVSGEYTFKEVQQLTHYKVPMFGPTAHRNFLMYNLDDEIEVNKSSKPQYLKWNDTIMPSPGRSIVIVSPSPCIN